MIAYILCGGLGTRLAPAWTGPKSLVPVEGRPFLHWQLDRLEQAGFTRANLLTGHGHHAVRDAAVRWRGAMALHCIQDPDVLPDGMSWGTGHAVRFALREERGPILLMYGDVFPRGDVSAPLRQARSGRVVMTVSRATNGSGNCILREGKVVDYGVSSQWLDAGCMALHPEHFRRISPMHRRRLEDWLHIFATAGIVDAYVAPPSLDVGTPEGLALTRAALALKEAL